MAHVPHLHVDGPWNRPQIQLEEPVVHHLRRVLRRRDGDLLSYTDGRGTIGTGMLSGSSLVRTGDEVTHERDRILTLAVAPPTAADRARFVVEKAAELGVAHLAWLRTRHTQGHVPKPNKAAQWSRGALEQSRGVWKMEVSGPVGWDALAMPLLVATPGGESWRRFESRLGPVLTIAVGPEGGLDPDELPDHAGRVSLSDRVLRVETAALAAAALALLPPDPGRAPKSGN